MMSTGREVSNSFLHLSIYLSIYLSISLSLYIYIYIYIRTQSKYTKRWKQSSDIKQLLITLLLAIKMCTDFTTDVVWMNTMCAVSLVNHLRAVADVLCPLRAHQHY